MTAVEYINNNDLMGAYERYQNAYPRWLAHWWNTVTTIYRADYKWIAEYVLDSVEHTLSIRMTQFTFDNPQIEIQCENEITDCGAYFVTHYLQGKLVWSKCGMTTRGLKRIEEHLKKDYRGQIDTAAVRLWFPCEDKEQADTMEGLIRKYFRDTKGYNFLNHDRFPGEDVLTKEDIQNLRVKYNDMLKLYQ